MLDFQGIGESTITANEQGLIKKIIGSFNALEPQKERDRFLRILDFLSKAKRAMDIGNMVLFLGIALEMLLLKDNPNNEQLSLMFRLRGSWLISETPEERVKVYDKLKELYTFRSQVAHTGILEGGKPEKIQKVVEAFPEFQSLAERICRRLLENPNLRWNDIILGIVN